MRGIAILAVAGLALVASGTASAQQGVIMGDTITASGTVEKIDKANRQVTLKGADGQLVTVEVSTEAKRFDEVKVGDTVTITYVDAVVVRLKKPDEKSVNTLEDGEGHGRARTPRRIRGRQEDHDGHHRGARPERPLRQLRGAGRIEVHSTHSRSTDRRAGQGGQDQGGRPGGLHLVPRGRHHGEIGAGAPARATTAFVAISTSTFGRSALRRLRAGCPN